MEKILTLTEEQFNKIQKAMYKGLSTTTKIIKEIIELPPELKVGIGDTAVEIPNAKPYEVYKNTWKGKDYYYIVINPLSNELAMAYSVYPKE